MVENIKLWVNSDILFPNKKQNIRNKLKAEIKRLVKLILNTWVMKITRLSKKAFGNDFLVAAGCCCNCNTCTTCCWGWFESEVSITAQ